jgi:hypothetical protein
MSVREPKLKALQQEQEQEQKVKSSYEILSAIDMSKFIEDKSFDKNKGLKYISWVHAMNILYSYFPDAHIEILRYDNNPYYQTPLGFFVEVKVSLNCPKLNTMISRTCILPVLDYANKPVSTPNPFHINTTQQRAIAKCIAYHGLGISVYAGEDLPINQFGATDVTPTKADVTPTKAEATSTKEEATPKPRRRLCSTEQQGEIKNLWLKLNAPIEKLSAQLNKEFNEPKLANLTDEQATKFIEFLTDKAKHLK